MAQRACVNQCILCKINMLTLCALLIPVDSDMRFDPSGIAWRAGADASNIVSRSIPAARHGEGTRIRFSEVHHRSGPVYLMMRH